MTVELPIQLLVVWLTMNIALIGGLIAWMVARIGSMQTHIAQIQADVAVTMEKAQQAQAAANGALRLLTDGRN